MGFFTGSSPCYCCGNKYWIRKYDPIASLPVIAQADITPVPAGSAGTYAYPSQLIARGSKVTSIWINGDDDRFSRYSSNLEHERNIDITHTASRIGSKWWDTNGSNLVVIVNGGARYYDSSGTLVYTFTPTGTESLRTVAIDSVGNMYSTTVSETTFPPVTNRFLYKHSATGVLQWKNATNSNAESFLVVASDDYVWAYRPSISLAERRSAAGALNSATIDLGGTSNTQAAYADGTSGIWVADSAPASGGIRTRHVTSALVVDRGWWGPGASGTLPSPNAPNLLAFDAMNAVYAKVTDVYFSTGASETIQKLDTYGNAVWSKNRTQLPSYWGYGVNSFPLSNDVRAIAYADGALYAGGMRTS